MDEQNTVLNGQHTFDHGNGIVEICNYVNDKLEGKYSRYVNEILTETTYYSGNKLNGIRVTYCHGNMVFKSNYVNGLEHGDTYFYNSDGFVRRHMKYDNGKITYDSNDGTQ